jgi:signal transduction histidine kinase
MTLSLKTRLTLLITVLVLAVLVIVSFFTIINLTEELLNETRDKGELISRQIYEQVRKALASATGPPPEASDPEAVSLFIKEVLTKDSGLNSILESTIGFSPTILYLAVTDVRNVAVAHSDTSQVDKKLPLVEHFDQLRDADFITQLKILLYDQTKIYEVTYPMVDASNTTIGAVHVAMSTVLITAELWDYLRKNLLAVAVALLLATTLAAVVSHFLLRPLTFISAGIERMTRGEFGKPIKLARQDEFGLVSLRLNEIGQKLEVSREEADAIGQIVRSLEEKIIFINSKRQITLLSPSAANLLNIALEASLGKRLNEVLPPRHPLLDLTEAAFGIKQDVSKTNVQLPSSDKAITVRVHVLEEKNQSMGALVVLRDPETVARLENQLGYAKRLAALSRLTSGVAHEVKNPLNAIVIHLELLKARVSESSPDVEKNLSVITQEIKRLDRVVRNFLSFNKPVEVKLQEAEIHPIIQDVVSLAATEATRYNVQISIQNHNSLPKVRLDPDLMKQCLLNIVLNGCQAMPQGGQLEIASDVRNSSLEISIKDTGIGIAPESQGKIFNLYYTTKENGNGIGLATVFKIVQLHNGEILVNSEVGRGTTFTLRLPVV